MQAGLLTGGFTEMRAANLDDDDWRSRNENFRGEKLLRNLALAEALKPIAERHQVPLPAVAIAWVLAWPAVTGAIVGARNPRQVDGWVGGAGLTLSPAELREIAAAIQSTGAGRGPSQPA
jgi:aryl-alcohol dehydrogenase-like predicted oxidoreductase